ncbi:MAG: A/G-specific adenine glycosylase [Pseudomonadota bacterium]
MASTSFAQRLLTWHRVSGRHDLPWQRDITPYRVWVSEIMLQQTQVTTVIPYFERFMAHFPELSDLASASQDEVLQLWSGLGYYARGRNLHRAAQLAVEEHGGELPESLDELQNLPGIGRSTAGAILSIACGQRQPILDGNVKRVLARHGAIEGWPGRTAVARELWALADERTPGAALAGEYAQAIMDLGATLCTRSQPRCDACPVSEDCRALALGHPEAFPGKKPKKEKPVRRTRMWLVQDTGGRILLEQRPSKGLWGGLWVLPEQDPAESPEDWLAERGWLDRKPEPLPAFRHTFSHYHLDIEPLWLAAVGPDNRVAEPSAERPLQWYNPRQPEGGIAAPVARLIRSIELTGD